MYSKIVNENYIRIHAGKLRSCETVPGTSNLEVPGTK